MAERRSDAVRNRARLLAVARDRCASEGGVPALNELARAAGVGVGTVYRHFPDRDALQEALVAADLEWLVGDVEAAAAVDEPWAGVEMLVRAALAVARRDKGVGRVLFRGDAGDPNTQAALSLLASGSERVLERARRSGVLRTDVDGDDLRRLVCGIDHAARAGQNSAEAAERYAAIIMAGLRA